SLGANNFASAAWLNFCEDDASLDTTTHLRRQLSYAATWYQAMRASAAIQALHGLQT
ncbi:hypothetical protein OC835_006167, partial [Tilletia horrida]